MGRDRDHSHKSDHKKSRRSSSESDTDSDDGKYKKSKKSKRISYEKELEKLKEDHRYSVIISWCDIYSGKWLLLWSSIIVYHVWDIFCSKSQFHSLLSFYASVSLIQLLLKRYIYLSSFLLHFFIQRMRRFTVKLDIEFFAGYLWSYGTLYSRMDQVINFKWYGAIWGF